MQSQKTYYKIGKVLPFTPHCTAKIYSNKCSYCRKNINFVKKALEYSLLSRKLDTTNTHGTNNLRIPALVNCMNHLDNESCGRGRPIYLHVGEVLKNYKL